MSLALTERASLLSKARAFFQERNITETDVCILSRFAPIDLNIDVMEVKVSETEKGFLHTSPEYAMKRLLAAGSGDIYFLGHVFRKGEIGRHHNPEFTMAEWYRLGISFSQMIQETCEFLFLFFNPLPIRILSYSQAFSIYVGIDYKTAPLTQLIKIAGDFLPQDTSQWDRSSYLHLLLTHLIEPHLGRSELTVLTDYPPNEAALARTVFKEGELVAERFEIYYKGVELANGYHELSDGQEMRNRFIEENKQRQSVGKETYELDELFLTALSHLPKCCGVSVGFDRALMLRKGHPSLSHVLSYAWESPTHSSSTV